MHCNQLKMIIEFKTKQLMVENISIINYWTVPREKIKDRLGTSKSLQPIFLLRIPTLTITFRPIGFLKVDLWDLSLHEVLPSLHYIGRVWACIICKWKIYVTKNTNSFYGYISTPKIECSIHKVTSLIIITLKDINSDDHNLPSLAV